MIDIPSPLSTDPEDVAWALSTAEAMWKREGHLDALTWVRRAADAAEAAGDNERAIMLMRSAADISEWIRDNAPNEKAAPTEEPPPAEPLPPVAVPPSRPPQSTMDVDEEELLDIEVEIEEEAPRSPFVSASGVSAWDDEEVVTSAPRIGALGTPRAKGPPGPPPKKPPGPPPRRQATGAPPPRAPEPAIVSEEEAAPISSSALISEDVDPPPEPTPPPPKEAPVARAHIPPEPTLASPQDPAPQAVPRILTGRSTTHRQWPVRTPEGENIEETQAEWPPQEPTLQVELPPTGTPETPTVDAPPPEAAPIAAATPESPQIEETQTEWPPHGDDDDDVANELAAAIAADAVSIAKSSAEEEVPLSEGAFEDLGAIDSPLPAFVSAPEPELPTFQDEQARASFASSEAATSLRARGQESETETAGEAIAKEAKAAAPAEGSRASSGSMRAAKAPVLDFDGDILEPESDRPHRPASHAPPRRPPTAPPPAKIADKPIAPSQPPTRKVSMPAELIEASLAEERARRQQAEHERRAAAERERAELERVEAAERERAEKERRDAAEKSQAERAARLASELPPSPPPPEAVVEVAAEAASADGPPDLSNVPELDDLPEDVLTAFAAASEVHLLAKDEEVNGFALAYVLEGELDLSANVADVPAARIGAGTMVRTRGTVDAHLDVRLVGISEAARVVTWDAAAVSTALRDCPWVEDDLRAAGDRWQALAGVTLGALGDRLDPDLRGALMAELESRTLAPGDVLAKMGEPVPGLFVVGAGEILLQQDGTEVGALTPGDVVFPGETISHQKAPSTAVAGAGGAVILGADRKRMQELLMTFPPLLDLLAGL